MKTPNKELAWAAGFFDGEGCVGCSLIKRRARPNESPSFEVHVSIGQIDREVLDRFKLAVGEGKVYGPSKRKPPRKPVYTWGTSSKKSLVSVYKKLKPYLSSIKLDAFERVIQAILERKRTQHERLSCAAKKRAAARRLK